MSDNKHDTYESIEKTVLIVEDEEDLIDLLSAYLISKGYNILAANTGPEALEIYAKKKVDAILLDWMLPGMSGIEVCKELKKDPKNKELPIIFMSAKDMLIDIETAIRYGATYYISKPFAVVDVFSVLNKCCPVNL